MRTNDGVISMNEIKEIKLVKKKYLFSVLVRATSFPNKSLIFVTKYESAFNFGLESYLVEAYTSKEAEDVAKEKYIEETMKIIRGWTGVVAKKATIIKVKPPTPKGASLSLKVK